MKDMIEVDEYRALNGLRLWVLAVVDSVWMLPSFSLFNNILRLQSAKYYIFLLIITAEISIFALRI